MVLDEPTNADEVFKINGFTMVVNRTLLELQGRLVLRQFLGEAQELQLVLVKVPPMG